MVSSMLVLLIVNPNFKPESSFVVTYWRALLSKLQAALRFFFGGYQNGNFKRWFISSKEMHKMQ